MCYIWKVEGRKYQPLSSRNSESSLTATTQLMVKYELAGRLGGPISLTRILGRNRTLLSSHCLFFPPAKSLPFTEESAISELSSPHAPFPKTSKICSCKNKHLDLMPFVKCVRFTIADIQLLISLCP